MIYEWEASGTNDQAINATMTVDNNLPTIPTSAASVADTYSGDVYVAWTSIDVNTSIPIAPFNPNRTKLVVSSDGGNNFSPVTIADYNNAAFDDNGNFTNEHDTTPAITVSQGRAASESGQSGDSGIPGGQVAVSWADFGANQVQLMANTVSAGRDYSFGGQTGNIPFGTYLSGGTAFSVPVSISNTTGLDTLDVTVNIVDSSDANLGLVLEAPSGDTFTLLLNQTIDTNPTTTVTNTGQGLSGTDLGVVSANGLALGTTFDDNATRDIFDPTTTGTNAISGPAFGDYRPEGSGFGFGFGGGGSLDAFLQQELAKGINGTWKLITLDSNTSAPSSPNYIIDWSLSFGRGLRRTTTSSCRAPTGSSSPARPAPGP